MATLDEMVMRAAGKAGIRPNERIRFIVDYGNGVDPVEPCAAVMTFCEHLLALQSLSQEAVRDEAMEKAAKVCDAEATKGEPFNMIRSNTAKDCATAIRAII